jgi:MFS family permease
LPLYVLHAGGTAADWGAIFACFSVAMAVGEFGNGILSDRVGSRGPLALTRLCSASALLGFSTLPGLVPVYPLQVVRAFGDSGIWATGKAYLGRTVSAASKGYYLGLFGMVVSVGTMIGSSVGGLLVERAGFSPAFVLGAVASIVASLVFWLGLREPAAVRERRPVQDRAARRRATSPRRQGIRWTPRRVLALVSVTVMPVAGWAAMMALLPIIASTYAGLGPAEVGLLVSIFGLTSILLGVPLGHFSDRFGRRQTIVAGLLVIVLGQVCLGLYSLPLLLIAGPVFNAIGWNLCSPAMVALISDLMPVSRQGLALAWIGSLEGVGMVLGGALSGFLLAYAGPEFTSALVALLLLAGAALCWVTVTHADWQVAPRLDDQNVERGSVRA